MSNILSQDLLLKSFLSVYFYELEKKINDSENGLKDIKFQSEEANTDEHIKEYFKTFILDNNNIEETSLTKVIIEDKAIEVEGIKKYTISNVFLPNNLTSELKQKLKESKPNSVFTNPDLYLEISDGSNTWYESVELKSSTTGGTIPGSSIQQINPFEYVIFVNRKNSKITTGHYLNSITSKLPFPDRSPRPIVSFKTLEKWNKNNRTIHESTLNIKTSVEEEKDKIALLEDWRDVLVKEWLTTIKNDAATKEKWFNNVIRKFSLEYLNYIQGLSEEDIQALKTKLENSINGNADDVDDVL